MKINNKKVESENVEFSMDDVLKIILSTMKQTDEAYGFALVGTALKAYCDMYDKPLAKVCVELCQVDALAKEVGIVD